MKKIWIFRMVAICAALAVALGITALPSHCQVICAQRARRRWLKRLPGTSLWAEPATESPRARAGGRNSRAGTGPFSPNLNRSARSRL